MAKHITILYDDAVAVTKSDTTADPKGPFAGVYTGEGGDIKVTTLRGTSITFKSTAAGSILPVAVSRVWSTGTSATTPLGLYDAEYYGARQST